MSVSVKWHGLGGHFIGAPGCCWHLHTVVADRWRISSVGCYHSCGIAPTARTEENRNTLGANAGTYYETMVFEEKGGEVLDFGSELECVRYATEEEADAGHARVLAHWIAKADLEP